MVRTAMSARHRRQTAVLAGLRRVVVRGDGRADLRGQIPVHAPLAAAFGVGDAQ